MNRLQSNNKFRYFSEYIKSAQLFASNLLDFEAQPKHLIPLIHGTHPETRKLDLAAIHFLPNNQKLCDFVLLLSLQFYTQMYVHICVCVTSNHVADVYSRLWQNAAPSSGLVWSGRSAMNLFAHNKPVNTHKPQSSIRCANRAFNAPNFGYQSFHPCAQESIRLIY